MSAALTKVLSPVYICFPSPCLAAMRVMSSLSSKKKDIFSPHHDSKCLQHQVQVANGPGKVKFHEGDGKREKNDCSFPFLRP